MICSVSIGTYSQTASWRAISDTGTTLIYGPPAVISAFAAQIGAYNDPNEYDYV
jgi:hypothetical protein